MVTNEPLGGSLPGTAQAMNREGGKRKRWIYERKRQEWEGDPQGGRFKNKKSFFHLVWRYAVGVCVHEVNVFPRRGHSQTCSFTIETSDCPLTDPDGSALHKCMCVRAERTPFLSFSLFFAQV